MRELEKIYRKRRKQLLPLALGFASVFVIFRIILPQWSDITDAQALISTKSDTVKAKQATVNLLNSMPEENVNNDYNLVTTALPIQKDIILIYTELNDASTKAGVKLGGFTVKVGGIYSTTPKNNQIGEKTISGVPFLNILVNVSGENADLRRFAQILYKSMPVVEIKSIDISKKDARYDVNFYFKPVGLKPDNADSVALEPFNPIENSQLKQLRTWKE